YQQDTEQFRRHINLPLQLRMLTGKQPPLGKPCLFHVTQHPVRLRAFINVMTFSGKAAAHQATSVIEFKHGDTKQLAAAGSDSVNVDVLISDLAPVAVFAADSLPPTHNQGTITLCFLLQRGSDPLSQYQAE